MGDYTGHSRTAKQESEVEERWKRVLISSMNDNQTGQNAKGERPIPYFNSYDTTLTEIQSDPRSDPAKRVFHFRRQNNSDRDSPKDCLTDCHCIRCAALLYCMKPITLNWHASELDGPGGSPFTSSIDPSF